MSTKRQIQCAQIHGVVSGYLTGTRRDLTSRDLAIAEIHETTRDVDVLAEAAAVWLVPGDGEPNMPAVELLIAAGADRQALQRYADVRRARPRGFDLGAMADRGMGADRPSAEDRPTP